MPVRSPARKIVITYAEEPGAPQYTAVIKRWNLEPKFTEELFHFVPPEGATSLNATEPAAAPPASCVRDAAQGEDKMRSALRGTMAVLLVEPDRGASYFAQRRRWGRRARGGGASPAVPCTAPTAAAAAEPVQLAQQRDDVT